MTSPRPTRVVVDLAVLIVASPGAATAYHAAHGHLGVLTPA